MYEGGRIAKLYLHFICVNQLFVSWIFVSINFLCRIKPLIGFFLYLLNYKECKHPLIKVWKNWWKTIISLKFPSTYVLDMVIYINKVKVTLFLYLPFFVVFLAITFFFSKFPLIYAIISNNRRIFLYNKNKRLITCRKLATLHELINKLNQDLLYGKYTGPWSAPKIIFFLFILKKKSICFRLILVIL